MDRSRDQLRAVFHAAGRRLTPQRRLILEVLERSDGHLDAEALHDRVKLEDPDISLATVYRTLAVLKEMELVEEHRLGEGHSHYEPVRDDPHYHFICLGCGKVIEFDTRLVAKIEQELIQREGIQVAETHLRLSGYCAQCQFKAGGQRNCDKHEKKSEDEPGSRGVRHRERAG